MPHMQPTDLANFASNADRALTASSREELRAHLIALQRELWNARGSMDRKIASLELMTLLGTRTGIEYGEKVVRAIDTLNK